ncbi:AAA family ATPase [Alicyclobacillus ferrooxydans]|uniref:Nuclease SbcCD subunit C n=1 Tax=Alicyclobacillus ferrooxydans TaxID=471514 RepID=A0A0N8PPS2_9BACL|nr:AAA family ATPase [Alicyclobacillus ferrooxydans]KPV45117.1 hypothetical protein AN477_03790 [Alicyclobacillus ferrooxydans]
MKPIRLSIAGLNSFRDKQEIDFTKLTELGMFGIFGPTGSGKSTILDALTLALYNNVVRAGRNTQGILNQAEKKIDIALDFEIGSAATRKRYRVERVYKKGSGEFSVSNQSSRLLLLEPMAEGSDYGLVIVAEGQREVNQAIHGIVGLTQEDFTRAVVLPQGKFAEFLQLTGRSRNEMTERLFGLQKYGQLLVSRASDWANQALAQRNQLVAQQGELGDASEQAVRDAEQTLEEAKERLDRADKERAAVQTRFKQLEQIHDLITQLNSATAEMQEWQGKAGEMDVIRQALERHGQAATVWPLVKTWREADAAVREAEVTLQAAQAAEEEAKAALDVAVEARNRARAQKADLEPDLTVKKSQLREAQTVESELTKLTGELETATSELKTARERYSDSVAKRDVLQGEIQRLDQDRDAAQRDLARHTVLPQTRQHLSELGTAYQAWKAATKDVNSEQGKLTEREKQLQFEDAEVEKWQKKEQGFTAEVQALGTQVEEWNANSPTVTSDTLVSLEQWQVRIEAKTDSLRALEREVVTGSKRIQEAENAVRGQNTLLSALRVSAAEAEQAWRNLENEYQRYLETNESGWIARLQLRLQDGEPCPVCGSVHHPSVVEELVQDSTASAESQWSTERMEALRQAQDTLQAQRDQVHAAEVTLGQAKTRLDLVCQDTAEKQQQLEEGLKELAEVWVEEVTLLVSASVPSTYEEWKSFVHDFKKALGAAKQRQQKWDQGLRELQDKSAELAEKLRDAKQQLSLVLSSRQTSEAEVTRQQTELDSAVRAKGEVDRGLRQTIFELGLAVEAATTDVEMESIIQARLEQAKEDDRLASEAQMALTDLDGKLATARSQWTNVDEVVRQADQDMTKLELQLEHITKDVNTRKAQLEGHTGGLSVAAAMQQVEQKLAELTNEAERTEKDAETASDRHQKGRQAYVKAETTLGEKTRAAEGHHAKLTESLADTRFATVEAVEDALLDDNEVEEKQKTVTEYAEAVTRCQNRCADLKNRLGGRSVDEETMEHIRQEVKDAEAEHQLAAETQVIAKMKHEELLDRKERWEALEKERMAAEALATRLGAITSALRGNAFVRYVAKEQMEVVARQASDRLAGLTRGRYALTFDKNGEFLMRDDHNGGTTRPVNTLSGGETFLTSLSLALALSAHIQLRGQHPLEFFFLDEGFGTLDPDLLDVVVSSLERLNLDRTSIGLISHVPELRQRMQRRLIVEPALPAGRGTQVRVEMA